MKAIGVWNESSLETREQICSLLRWPASYAEGEASPEWLTSGQLKKLRKLQVDAYWEDGEFQLGTSQ